MCVVVVKYLIGKRVPEQNPQGRRNGGVVKRLDYWPHTSSVQVPEVKKNLSEYMRFGCRLPIAVVSQAYPGYAEI